MFLAYGCRLHEKKTNIYCFYNWGLYRIFSKNWKAVEIHKFSDMIQDSVLLVYIKVQKIVLISNKL